VDYQYRNGGGCGWDGGELSYLVPPAHLSPQQQQQMHQPVARRPITGNSFAPPSPAAAAYRPHQHFAASPGPPPAQFLPAKGYAPGWGSPSWSGNGPPPAPPPISMTPPPVSWGGQQQGPMQGPRRPPVMPQAGEINVLAFSAELLKKGAPVSLI
jgi:hypothetical protein